MDAFWQTQNTFVSEVSLQWERVKKTKVWARKQGEIRGKKRVTETQHTELGQNKKEKETDQCKGLELRNLAEPSRKSQCGTTRGERNPTGSNPECRLQYSRKIWNTEKLKENILEQPPPQTAAHVQNSVPDNPTLETNEKLRGHLSPGPFFIPEPFFTGPRKIHKRQRQPSLQYLEIQNS